MGSRFDSEPRHFLSGSSIVGLLHRLAMPKIAGSNPVSRSLPMSKSSVSWRFLAALTLIIISGVLIAPPNTSFERITTGQKVGSLSSLPLIRGNSLLTCDYSALEANRNIEYLKVLVTAYSSRPEETDADPFITASGEKVRPGIVANNALPFGTIVKFPQLFGNQTFVVQDRMNIKKRNNHIDIWFPSTEEALRFGAKTTVAKIEKKL